MLTAHRLCKSYGLQTVLHEITFSISAGDRLGLIGPNGCGKTTLLRILAGLERPDSGTVTHTRPGLRLGYLAQGFDLDPSLTLEQALGHDSQLEERLAGLAAALAVEPASPALQAQYDDALARLSALALQPDAVRVPLGLAGLPADCRLGELSGGQKTRLMLARLLLSEPDLLLLDEPTNHLDIAMLEWLESWLGRFHGAALIVSHDRAFLDNSVTRLLEMDPQREGLHEYAGNYSAYFEQRQAEIAQQWSAYQDQQAEVRRLQADILRTKAQAAHTERMASSIRIGGGEYKQKGYKSYQQGIAKKVAKKAKAREKRLERFLESDEIVERPRASWQIKLEFADPGHQSRDVLVTRDLSIGYPGRPALLTGLDLHIRRGQRVAFTGPNGCGKTTLLRTLAGRLEPVSGSVRIGASFQPGYMAQEQEDLDPACSPLELIQAAGLTNPTQARSFLHAFLFGGDAPLRPCGEMSFGERARLELALLIARGCTFLILDEPINHLDIPSRARFEQALGRFDGTVLAVVHDRYFIGRFATDVWVFDGGRIRVDGLAYEKPAQAVP